MVCHHSLAKLLPHRLLVTPHCPLQLAHVLLPLAVQGIPRLLHLLLTVEKLSPQVLHLPE